MIQSLFQEKLNDMRLVVFSLFAFCLLNFTSSGVQAKTLHKQSFVYTKRAGASVHLTSLDVYWHRGGTGRPVMVYVHGGSWRSGDKTAVHRKPAVFTRRGYVFVSVNYRLSPRYKHPAHRNDVVAALDWVVKNANRFGGDTHRIFVMGHSSGAHIAAMAAIKIGNNRIKAVVSLDSPIFDLPAAVKMRGGLTRDQRPAFGKAPKDWIDASPALHISNSTPPFLLFHTGNRVFAAQSKGFAKRLSKAGVGMEIHFTRDGHMTLDSGIGRRNDVETTRIFRFLRRYGG